MSASSWSVPSALAGAEEVKSRPSGVCASLIWACSGD